MRVWEPEPAIQREELAPGTPYPRPTELSLARVTPETLRSLGAAAGNQAVARMLARGSSPLAIQRNDKPGCDDDLSVGNLFDEPTQGTATAVQETGESEEGSAWGNLFEEAETATGSTAIATEVSSQGTTSMAEPRVEPEVPATGTLQQRMEAAFGLEVGIEKVLDAIRGASAEDRAAAASNEAFVDSLRDRLRKGNYLQVVAALGVRREGQIAHKRPEEADRLVREKLGESVREAAASGAKIAGKIAVLTGANWDYAVEQHFKGRMPSGMIETEKRQLNAFFHEDLVFIHGDRGNPGTTIHEAVHKYSKEDLQQAVGRAVNEGVTEYFARKITDELQIQRTQYAKQLDAARSLVQVAGEPTVVDAYFGGNVQGLKSRFLTFRRGKSGDDVQAERDWETFLTHVKKDEPEDDWEQGAALLQ